MIEQLQSVTMDNYLYRYRPIDAVLDGFHELDEQQIYFSTPAELNDPMEGFRDLFWKGDAIVWRNLLKHYFLCLLQTTYYCFVAGAEFKSDILDNFVFSVPETLPRAPIRDIYSRLTAEFLATPVVEKFLHLMGSRTTEVRRNELTGYLRAMHSFAIPIILTDLRNRGLTAPQGFNVDPAQRETLTASAIKMMEGVTKITSEQYPPERISEALFSVNEAAMDQMMMIAECRSADWTKEKPIAFFTHRFPTKYVAALDKLVYRDWYAACFANTPSNHSMWSTYAGGHRGVCLIFKPNDSAEGDQTLTLTQITSMGGSPGHEPEYGRSEVRNVIRPVRYTTEYPPIDFFRSLGAIPQSHMDQFWYSGDKSFSTCRDAIYTDIDGWRRNYWKRFDESTMCKTPEWAHEQEHRIVIHSSFDIRPKERRKLGYRFQDLAGIVFGIRTDSEDKLKIIKIIDAKCAKAKRSDFKFFELRYLNTESRFQVFPLNLIQIKY